ncbi:MAG: hypothetical protein PHG58_02145 [Clostridia bacterium]|nr:hypothetical protein [Clostridia bacterium]
MKCCYDITFHPSWWYKNAGINFGKRFFYDSNYRIEADIHMRKCLYDKFGEFGLGEKEPNPRPIIDSDLVAGEYLQSMMLGCEIQFSDQNLPEVLCANLNESQIENIIEKDLSDYEGWKEIASQIDYLEEKFGFIESHIDLHGVQNLALDLRGMELFIDYYEQPQTAQKLLKTCAILIGRVGEYLSRRSQTLSAGVTSIMKQIDPSIFVTSNCTVEMVSNEVYETHLLQWDNYLASHFKGFGLHHCGKTMEHLIQGYSKVQNVCFLEVGAFSNIKKMRSAFPDTFLNLRYSPVRLKEVSPDELKSDIMLMLEDGYKKGKTSFSCVGIDADTSDEKIKEFLSIVRG